MGFIKRHIVPILSIIGFLAPLAGMMLTEVYYYSSLIGWIVGFVFIVTAYIVVTKQPDETEEKDLLEEN